MTLAQRLSLLTLRLSGWRGVFVPPPCAKGIILVYPHTSNWDFPTAILYKITTGLPLRWLGKDSLFRWPFRRLLVRLGGIPVNRRDPSGFVDTLLREFSRSDFLWLGMAPEGTRKYTDHWKSGFYRIARAGQLPVGLGFIDYATKTIGIERYLDLTGDLQADLGRIRTYYADKRGRYPKNAGDIRLRE